MFAGTRANQRLLAGAIALNLVLALVVAIGAMVRPVNAGMLLPSRPAAVPGASGPTQEPAAGPSTDAPPTEAAAAGPAGRKGTPAHAGAARRSQVPGTPAVDTPAAARLASTGPAVAAAVAASGPAPRVEPTRAALQAAIRELDARTNYFRPTENQVRDFSGQACTAFDQGYSYAQVKSAVLDSARRAPYLGISTADADFAIRSAVRLFCPGYAHLLP